MRNRLKIVVPALAAASALVLFACSSTSKPQAAAAPAPATQPVTSAEKGGAQLWQENCTRCHNLRPPTSFSDTEWDIIVHHMRIRAGLTGQEQRSIATFLKSAN